MFSFGFAPPPPPIPQVQLMQTGPQGGGGPQHQFILRDLAYSMLGDQAKKMFNEWNKTDKNPTPGGGIVGGGGGMGGGTWGGGSFGDLDLGLGD